MNPDLPQEAQDFGASADRAFAALGGVDAARRAEEEPARRAGAVADTLKGLGIDDLDPRNDPDSLAAAARLCEAAGRVALPYPVAAVLLRHDGLPFAVTPRERLRVDHGDLFDRWRVASLNGGASIAAPKEDRLGSRLGPFVTELVATRGTGSGPDPAADVRLHLALTAWLLLGTLDRAVELTVEHVTGREQFGKPLAAFQAVQFQLADAAVAVAGLRELALHALWRLGSAPGDALADVLALRLQALDAARAVLRTCQQLHGAAGVCEEYDVSVLARHAQPSLRLPFGAERTAAALSDAIRRDGFEGLFGHAGAAG